MRTERSTSAARDFEELIGQRVSAVCFVSNYVELHFDGPILRSLADPSVTVDGERHRFPERGSRDALCGLVGREVRIAEDRDDALSLFLTGDAEFHIPKASRDAGPEIAHYVPAVVGRLDVAAMAIWENLVPTRQGPAGRKA